MNMIKATQFYICPTCFAATETEPIGHPHAMIHIDLSSLEAINQGPPVDATGTMQTRRPAWFLAATQQARQQLKTVHKKG